MHENRETSSAPEQSGRFGKVNSHNPDANALEESDCAVVPMKQPNKAEQSAAEVVEGRAQTKENDAGPGTSPTRSGERVSQGLGGVRQAARFPREFQERLARFGLEIHLEKTRLIEFGRFAQVNRNKRGEGKPETFTFLGFTHYCGRNSKGSFVVWRRTAAKRMRGKLLQLKQELRRKMHEPAGAVGEWLRRVVEGYYRYRAVPGNLVVLGRFRDRLCMPWRQALRRRSQRRKPGWDQLRPTFERWIPRPRILHPYPGARFDATHPRQEPYAVVPLVRICAGGGQRWPSLPRPANFRQTAPEIRVWPRFAGTSGPRSPKRLSAAARPVPRDPLQLLVR